MDAALQSLSSKDDGASQVAARLVAQEALDALETRRAVMEASFPLALDKAIADAVDDVQTHADRRASASASASGSTPPGDAELTLLEDSQLLDYVEMTRLIQVVLPTVEHTLARLDSLVSSVLDQPAVRADLNPLRPNVLCGALMQILGEQGVSTEVRRLWLRHMARVYAQEVDGLYAAVVALLEGQGVQEAHYRIKLVSGGMMGMAGMAGAPQYTWPSGFAPPGSAAAVDGGASGEELSDEEAIRRRRAPSPLPSANELADAQVPTAMMREFLDRPQWIAQFDGPLPPDYHAAVQRQLAQMAADPALQAASQQAHWRLMMELKAQATQMSQVLCIDAVRALVAQVAGDERLLAPVREAVLALEPALLRLALAEPHCSSESEHSVRSFIEEIAQRSFRYNDACEPEFASFIETVQQAVRELNAVAVPSGEDFAQRLQVLQEGWQAQDDAAQQAREQSDRSIEMARERQDLADKIAAGFAQRSDLVGVPAVVTEFLLKDWSLVIAHAQLTDTQGQLDPGGYLSIVTDLLWSVKCEDTLPAPARLFELVPRVLATLRKGLDMLGKEPRESQALFDMLLHFHQPVLALRRLRKILDKGKSAPPDAHALIAMLPPRL